MYLLPRISYEPWPLHVSTVSENMHEDNGAQAVVSKCGRIGLQLLTLEQFGSRVWKMVLRMGRNGDDEQQSDIAISQQASSRLPLHP